MKEKIVAGGITLLILISAGLYMGGARFIKEKWADMKGASEAVISSPKSRVKTGRKKGKGGHRSRKRKRSPSKSNIGIEVDQLDGVRVFYNGPVSHVSGRNTAPDGYNLGLKYQCVEFIKRYYYQHYGHKMPNANGNAADYFDPSLKDGAFNRARGLYQFRNGSQSKPHKGDIVVFKGPNYTRFGHVAIIAGVYPGHIQIIQQNPGPGNPPRVDFSLSHQNGKWRVLNPELLGWLGKRG